MVTTKQLHKTILNHTCHLSTPKIYREAPFLFSGSLVAAPVADQTAFQELLSLDHRILIW